MVNKPNIFNIANGIKFTAIKDDRFKTGRISISIFLPLNNETASQNALLPFILIRSCKKYPDFTKLNKKLSDLYGAELSADIDKIGEAQVLSITATFLDDRYALNSECISGEITELLCDIIFSPNVENNSFTPEAIEQEKRQLIEMIDAEYNDKKVYAKQQCISIMCKNEKFGINPLGTREKIEKLDGKDVYKTWCNMLKQAKFEIVMLGNSDHTSALNKFKKAFEDINGRDVLDCSAKIIPIAKVTEESSQKDNVSQCKLVMGFRTGAHSVDDNVAITRVMNALFGATPHSKLFLNVREKLSLCYYCVSRYDRNKGIITVESGVEKENIEAAKNEILSQLEDVKNGNFSDEDLKTTKLSLSNSFRTISDYLGGIENFYLSQVFSEKIKTPEEATLEVNSVTKEEIINAAKKLTLDTVYSLIN